MTEKTVPTPRCDAEKYESGPTAANYGINDPDVVVDYTFAQQLERELVAAHERITALEADRTVLREALIKVANELEVRCSFGNADAAKAVLEKIK